MITFDNWTDCAHCGLPVGNRRYFSTVLGAFCSPQCYEAEWALVMPRRVSTGGLPIQEDVDYVDMEGPNETVVG